MNNTNLGMIRFFEIVAIAGAHAALNEGLSWLHQGAQWPFPGIAAAQDRATHARVVIRDILKVRCDREVALFLEQARTLGCPGHGYGPCGACHLEGKAEALERATDYVVQCVPWTFTRRIAEGLEEIR